MFVNHSYLGSNLPTQTHPHQGVSLHVWLDCIPFTTAVFGLLSRHSRTDDAIVRSITGSSWAQARGPSGQDPSDSNLQGKKVGNMARRGWVFLFFRYMTQQVQTGETGVEGSGSREPCEEMNSEVAGRRHMGWVGLFCWMRIQHSCWDGELQDNFGGILFFAYWDWSGFRQEFALSQRWTVWLSGVCNVR